MKSIDVDLEVYKLIESLRVSLDETHRDILLRSLQIVSNLKNVQKAENSKKEEFTNTVLMKSPNRLFEFFDQKTASLRLGQNGSASRDWIYNNIRLKEGTPLMKWFDGNKVEAKIENGGILVEGVSYQSPSAAAMAINGGKNVNGWVFWKFFDEKSKKWRKLNYLRRKEKID
ncbi:MAG TPA: hypothetical protein PKH65_05830 [Bacteroidia bacterium]|nr:hypothetical protein [Bacteroidia bacterium]HNT80183.1 hypothetical protein [Bacteroidia bacterium]